MMSRLFSPSQFKRALALANTLLVFAAVVLFAVPRPVSAADFNLDNKSDVVIANNSGLVDILLMNGAAVASRATIMNDAGWTVTHMADFNGDGKSDIIWRHTDGRIAMWLMNGTGLASGAGLLGAASGWSVTHVADFNGDGRADLLLSHTDGRVAMWLMNGTTLISGAGLLGAASGWSVTNVGDFNGDGKADILYRHTDGRIAMWLMNGTALTSGGGLLDANSGWTVTHAADFNGDGKADILYRHTDGRIAMWLMNGTALTSGGGLLGANSGWSVVQTGDFNGDGKADILYRHTDGRIALWLMNGTSLIAGAGLTDPGTWQVMPGAVVSTPTDSGNVAAINTSDRAAVLAAYQSVYVPTKATPYANSGLNVAACAAGDTTLTYKTAVIRMVNYYRAMSGLPGNVTLNAGLSTKAQQAALMMSANNQLRHDPPATWTCYSAAGADAAGHSNLALGAAGAGAIDLYISDVGILSLGHRRWIFYPPQTDIGTGDTSNANSLWVLGPFGSRPATPNGVAWPPAGFVPYQLAPSSMAWSFSMDGANFAGTSVSVTKVGAAGVPVTVAVLDVGYGDNTISFAPSGGAWPYAASGDTSFDVQVNNVMVGGVARNFSYRVTMIPAP